MTTITTAKLREIAHTLGTTPERLRLHVRYVFGVTIDDTPNTGEQSMTTITHEQFADMVNAENAAEFRALLAEAGITVAPPEPPEAMVELAREIVTRAAEVNSDDEIDFARFVAVAALQHAVKAVKNARRDCGPGASSAAVRQHILTALGAA